MTKFDPQLADRITQMVLQALKNTGNPAQTPADIHAPLGVCTGDYSKFTDRPDLNQTEKSENKQPEPAALSGVITAAMVDAIKGDTLVLDAKSKLTPLGADRVKERRMTVKRVSNPQSAIRNPQSNTWLWWIDGRCQAVEKLTTHLRETLTPLGARHDASQLHQAVRDAARRVRGGQAAGAILFVPSAALAVCYANRCPSLRAVVATCGEAVEQGVELLGANVMIVEYPHHGFRSMLAMAERFTSAKRPELTGVERQLKELASCE
ncbi:MAG: hypothetical protein WC058_02850 [Phycisphaeraceae bacterium]